MPKARSDRKLVLGFAWFDRQQWNRLTEVVDDRNELDDTFEQWERSALDALRTLERQGQRAEKVHIEVDAFVSWCKGRGFLSTVPPVRSTYRSCYNSAMGKPRSNFSCTGRAEARR